tara:strand:- start:40 stop:831 length:792 start_codon:yes stop_codon:yes gene_type:complete
MPTIRSIDVIKATLLTPATTSHFDVEISVPSGELGGKLNSVLGGSVQQDRLNIMCSDASLPGSSLATLELTNDHHGVTEKHAYRRIFEDRIDLTFYVDANGYLPIKFFETWMSEIMNEDSDDARSSNYFYRSKYPDDYTADQGLKIIKFEKDHNRSIEYEFFRTFPLAINSMPVSYDGSSLLKCTVSMCYIRYILRKPSSPTTQQAGPRGNTINDMAKFNSRSQGFNAGQLPNRVNDFTRAVQNSSLPLGANDQLRSIGSGLA